MITKKLLTLENPNPWNKIIINDINKKFFLKIYNYDEEKFIKWKTLIKIWIMILTQKN